VVEPLQGYISKLSHGEKGDGNGELHQTYDLISGAGTEKDLKHETYDLIGNNGEAIVILIVDLLSKG
jgi:hypothetical protein